MTYITTTTQVKESKPALHQGTYIGMDTNEGFRRDFKNIDHTIQGVEYSKFVRSILTNTT